MSDKTRIAVVAGDGTGPEVIVEGLKVLDAVCQREGIEYELTAAPAGASSP